MFQPCNKYILIERESKGSESESLIALPEGVFKNESEYERVRVLSVANEVKPPISQDQDIVVMSRMIEEVEFDNKTIYLILENYVLGIVGVDK
jgi:co-chaperonin GroES (HSP10)